ncbi:MAG: ABC transporter ATP-binding protein, partial [Acidobacteriota bacterium]|nr:ABC transporter ATP-binding protein [Acidobacteriota bacterium]
MRRGSRMRNVRGLLSLLAPYRARSWAAGAALLVGTAASLAPPLLAKYAIDEGILPYTHGNHPHVHVGVLLIAVLAFLGSALLVWAMTHAQTYLVGWIGQRALADLRIRIFRHL